MWGLGFIGGLLIYLRLKVSRFGREGGRGGGIPRLWAFGHVEREASLWLGAVVDVVSESLTLNSTPYTPHEPLRLWIPER